jgi:hydroxymethylpyrimidine pyrophosphatase-like HAD family hydrolase
MHYLAFASDYDGTLAKDGVVSPQTIEALERLGASGRQQVRTTSGTDVNMLKAI